MDLTPRRRGTGYGFVLLNVCFAALAPAFGGEGIGTLPRAEQDARWRFFWVTWVVVAAAIALALARRRPLTEKHPNDRRLAAAWNVGLVILGATGIGAYLVAEPPSWARLLSSAALSGYCAGGAVGTWFAIRRRRRGIQLQL
jgi:MFS family permease